jgi:hypothetical protein
LFDFTGALEVDSLNVTDLTDNRVLIAGASGEVEDDANFTFNGTTLALTGDQNITGNLDVSVAATLASAKIEDLTQNRVVFVGTGGELIDSNALRFDGSTLSIDGDTDITGNINIGGNIRIGDADVDTVNVVADFTSDLIPDVDVTFDLGMIGKQWGRIFVPTIKSDSGVVTFDATGAIKLPIGGTTDRPTAETGMIRYNTTDVRFEGYDGTQWAGLAGSVVDIDQDTKIVAESSPGADNDELEFYTAGVQRFFISNNGVITTAANTDLTFDIGGLLSVGNTIITGLGAPVNPSDAVNLGFINDNFSSNLDIQDGSNSAVIDILSTPTFHIGTGLDRKSVV